MPPKKQPTKVTVTEGNCNPMPLTLDNFGFALEQALGLQSVKETLQDALGPLIEILVSERVAKVEETFNAKLKDVKKEHERKVGEMREELKELRAKQNDLEQYSKREDLIIKGLHVPQTYAEVSAPLQANGAPNPERVSSTSVIDTVTKFFTKDLGVQVPPNAISTAHPLPSRNGTPSVIVRFASRDVRNTIYASRFRLKGKGIYLDEHLTPANAQLMFHARKLKNNGRITDCFSRNCTPCVRLMNRKVVPLTTDLIHQLG